MLNLDSDLGRHLILGRIILDTHQIPSRDLLSFTKAGQPRPPYEWLAQILFATAYKWLDLDGVILLTALVIAAAFMLLYIDTAQRTKKPIISLVIVIWSVAA
ncbi:MAG TPA: hypothetical protein VHM28_09630, partial [Anaerolineales bacterium]|nr:hypothetical protein [Anaerolineales bacterium]